MKALFVSAITAGVLRRAFQPNGRQWLAVELGALAAGLGSRRGPVAAWAGTLAGVILYQYTTALELRRIAGMAQRARLRVMSERSNGYSLGDRAREQIMREHAAELGE